MQPNWGQPEDRQHLTQKQNEKETFWAFTKKPRGQFFVRPALKSMMEVLL